MIDRTCTGCGETKPIEDFAWRNKAKGVLQGRCRSCMSSATRPHMKRRRFTRRGITQEDYERMHDEQEGLCFLCGQPEQSLNHQGEVRELAIDHNHKTGHNRKLLCGRCNRLAGQVEADPELFRRMLEYIEL